MTQRLLKAATTVLFAMAASSAFAAEAEPMPFTYQQFESSVPHFDLETCPSAFQNRPVFCRVSFQGDAVHLFVFSDDGEQPLVAFQSYEDEDYRLMLN